MSESMIHTAEGTAWAREHGRGPALQVGLYGPGGWELEAPWYRRLPWMPVIEWEVTKAPPERWFVKELVGYDASGAICWRRTLHQRPHCLQPGDRYEIVLGTP